MTRNIEHFREYVSKVMQPGQRNRYLKGCANKAKYYEIDELEALSIIKEYWGSDFKQTDETSFKNAFKNTKVPSTYSEDIANHRSLLSFIDEFKKEEKEISSIQAQVNREAIFKNYLNGLSKKINLKQWIASNKKEYEKKSSFMLNLFDKNDIIWVSNKVISQGDSSEMKDMLEWSNRNESLSRYNFFVINPFKSLNSQRSDSEIKTFKYILFEADYLDKKSQFYLWVDLINHGLPVKSIIFTGNKSLHVLVKCPKHIDSAEKYRSYVADIFYTLNDLEKDLIDEACKNPSRLSRIPFGIRDDEKVLKEEQKLVYLQTDEEKLNNDPLKIINAWVDSIKGKQDSLDTKSPKEFDEINENEVLNLLKNRETIRDIWNDGKCIHTLRKKPMMTAQGLQYYFEDFAWRSTSFFYQHILETLEEQYHLDNIDLDEVKKFRVRHKTAQKWPYVGATLPVKKDYVNTFIPGFLYEALNDKSVPAELNEPLEKLLKNIFGNDPVTRNWTLQWMREFMHTFDVITAPVFWGIPGTGKTMIAEAFGRAIGDWIKTPPKKDDIQFNAWQDHTVIIFEESIKGSKKDGKELGDLLKEWITGKEKTIEAKGKDPIKKTIKSCYIFNSNTNDQYAPVFIEDNDRRYTIIRNDSAKNLRDIWTDEDFNKWDSEEYQKILMKWIYNLPKDNSIDIRRGINNEYKQQVINLGKNNIEIAIEEISSTFCGFISNADLIQMIYTNYGIKSTSRANGNILTKLGFESKLKKIKGIDGKSLAIRGYEFNNDSKDAPQDQENIIDIIINDDNDQQKQQ